MKSLGSFAGLLFGLLLILVPGGLCQASEFQVFTVEEHKLTMDLGSKFQVYRAEIDANTSGIFSHDMMINSTDSQAGRLFLSIYGVYDDVIRRMSPSAVIDLFLSAEIAALENNGNELTGNWSAVNAQGENVTVFTFSTQDPKVPSESFDMAMWNTSSDKYVLMVSTMENNATRRVIETMSLD